MRFPTAERLSESLEAFKVGALYINLTGNNPANELGYGAWSAFAQGRCLVGVDPGDTDFDAAEKTSGAKTVTLAEEELPAHSHAVTDPGHTHVETNNSATTGPLVGFAARDTSTNNQTATGYSTESAQTGVSIQSTGGGQGHPNVQPSIAVHFWRRTA